MVTIGLGMVSCQSPPGGQLETARSAFQNDDYATAYSQSVLLTRTTDSALRTEAAYMAGVSAHKQGNRRVAGQYLQQAIESHDRQLVGDAQAELGLIYAEQQQYDRAARMMLAAAEHLDGQDRANAYYYAGLAQQKLGRWAQARTSLSLARSNSTQAMFRQQVNMQLSVTGYTLQVGAFAQQPNAQRAAEQLAARTRNAKLGLPRIVLSTDLHGQHWNLVQIGHFSSFATASISRSRLGTTQAIIVPLTR